jgi:hypothetical protein
MTTQSLDRIAGTLEHDFRSTAKQLRQESKLVTTDPPRRYHKAVKTLDRCAATVKDVDPVLLISYHELIVETPDRERHAELLRRLAFEGLINTATEYVSAYISDRTGGGDRKIT